MVFRRAGETAKENFFWKNFPSRSPRPCEKPFTKKKPEANPNAEPTPAVQGTWVSISTNFLNGWKKK